jgi:hypothetical protein
VDIARDLAQVLLIVFGTLGTVGLLLFVLAVIDPQTDKVHRPQPTRARRNSDRSPARRDGSARRVWPT